MNYNSIDKINNEILENKLDVISIEFSEKLDTFNKYFTSKVEPQNNVYGITEIIKDDGILIKRTKLENSILNEYYKDGALTWSSEKINNNTIRKLYYDDNGSAYIEKTLIKKDARGYLKDSERLLPNNIIQKNNVTTITDANGRVINAKATDISLKNSNRESLHLDKTGKGYVDGDQIGHLIPDSFNGKNTLENLVPQTSEVNLGKIKQVENIARDFKKSGSKVDYEIKVNYGDPNNPNRPTSFEPKITVDGKVQELSLDLKKIYNDSNLTNVEKVKVTINEKVSTIKTATIDAHGYGKEAALITGGLTFVTSTAEDVKMVIDGQMDVDDMVLDIVKDTVTAGGFGYVEGFAESAICTAMRASGNQMISGLAKTGIPAMVIDFGIKSYDSVTDYLEGKIDEIELLYDFGENATTTIASFESAKIGAALGSGLGPIGTIGGGLVGGMVGYCVASEIYVAAIEAGIEGAEYLGQQVSEIGQSCIKLVSENVPEFVDEISSSLNDFAKDYNLPFQF